MNSSVRNVLFIQDSSPCIRTIKLASALNSKGLNIHLVHRNKTPDKAYGYGNSSFDSLTQLPKYGFKDLRIIRGIINSKKIDLLHFHNYPDKLGAKLIKADLDIPIIYDQHDFFSIKKRLSSKKCSFEKICNEKNDGAVYITENYRYLVSQKYQINSHNLIFPNYGLSSFLLDKKDFLPKLSKIDNKVHMVYVGLITQHKNKVRNMLDIFKLLSDKGFIIHVYSTRNKEYEQYKKITNVKIHSQLPVSELIRAISKYDFGIVFLNKDISNNKKKEEIKYGFWNKMYDYLMAGIPVITSDFYKDMSDFIRKNEFGISVKNIKELSPDFLQKQNSNKISDNIILNREKWTMENQIQKVIDFYHTTLEKFYAKHP